MSTRCYVAMYDKTNFNFMFNLALSIATILHLIAHFSDCVGYLKLFQLHRPHHQVTGYDCILIDESEDLSPGQWSKTSIRSHSLSSHNGHQTCPKIFIDDPHQQIF